MSLTGKKAFRPLPQILLITLITVAILAYFVFFAAKALSYLSWLGIIPSLLCLLLLVSPKANVQLAAKPPLKQTLARISGLFLLQMLFMAFYFATMTHVAMPHLHPLSLEQFFRLQPFSLSTILTLIFAVNYYPRQKKPTISSAFRFLQQRHWVLVGTIDYYSSRVLLFAFMWVLAFATILIAQCVCQLLQIKMIAGISLPSLLLTALLFSPISVKQTSQSLRFLAGKQVPVAVYYLVFSLISLFILITFSGLIHLAYITMAAHLPKRVMVKHTINSANMSYGLFSLGWMVCFAYLQATALTRCARGLNLRQIIIAAAVLPLLASDLLRDHLLMLFAGHAGLFIILAITSLLLLYFAFCHDDRFIYLGFLKNSRHEKRFRPIQFMRSHYFSFTAATIIFLLGGVNFLHVLTILLAVPALVFAIIGAICFAVSLR